MESHKTSIHYPRLWEVKTAHTIAKETRSLRNAGKLARRTTVGMLWRFAKGLTVTVYEGKHLASTASITYRGEGLDRKTREEVGTVIVFPGFEGNGYGPDAVGGIVERRRGKASGWFAMVNIGNEGGLRSFSKMHGSVVMSEEQAKEKIPSGAYNETVTGAREQIFTIFDVTNTANNS